MNFSPDNPTFVANKKRKVVEILEYSLYLTSKDFLSSSTGTGGSVA